MNNRGYGRFKEAPTFGRGSSLLSYIKYQTKYKYSLLHLTRVIRECLFNRADIIDLLNMSLKKVQRLRDPCYEISLF